MYTVASYLAELRSSASFSQYLQHNFLKLPGLESTSLQPKEARVKGLGDKSSEGCS